MLDILDIREYEGGSLAELYNTKTMPKSLRQKHEEQMGLLIELTDKSHLIAMKNDCQYCSNYIKI